MISGVIRILEVVGHITKAHINLQGPCQLLLRNIV